MSVNEKDISAMFEFVRVQLTSGLYNIQNICKASLISRTSIEKIRNGKMVNPSIVVALHAYFKNLTKG
jgi:hypothetical protein